MSAVLWLCSSTPRSLVSGSFGPLGVSDIGGGGREAATTAGPPVSTCIYTGRCMPKVSGYISYMCCCVYHVTSCAQRVEAKILSDDSTLSSKLKLQLQMD